MATNKAITDAFLPKMVELFKRCADDDSCTKVLCNLLISIPDSCIKRDMHGKHVADSLQHLLIEPNANLRETISEALGRFYASTCPVYVMAVSIIRPLTYNANALVFKILKSFLNYMSIMPHDLFVLKQNVIILTVTFQHLDPSALIEWDVLCRKEIMESDDLDNEVRGYLMMICCFYLTWNITNLLEKAEEGDDINQETLVFQTRLANFKETVFTLLEMPIEMYPLHKLVFDSLGLFFAKVPKEKCAINDKRSEIIGNFNTLENSRLLKFITQFLFTYDFEGATDKDKRSVLLTTNNLILVQQTSTIIFELFHHYASHYQLYSHIFNEILLRIYDSRHILFATVVWTAINKAYIQDQAVGSGDRVKKLIVKFQEFLLNNKLSPMSIFLLGLKLGVRKPIIFKWMQVFTKYLGVHEIPTALRVMPLAVPKELQNDIYFKKLQSILLALPKK